MPNVKRLKLRQGRVLLLKFGRLTAPLNPRSDIDDKIYFDSRHERELIELVGSLVGFDRFELDREGMFIPMRAVDSLLIDAEYRRKAVDSRLKRKRAVGAGVPEAAVPTVADPVTTPPSQPDSSTAVHDRSDGSEVVASTDPFRWLLLDYDVVLRALQGCSDSKDRIARKQWLERLKYSNIRRLPAVIDTHLELLENLRGDFPNFGTAIDLIRDHLCLLLLGKAPLSLPPMLLLGPPGVGKTYFVKALGDALNLSIEMRSLAETSASFVLNGLHQTWGGAQLGAVAKLVIEAPSGTLPLLLLDEIDKPNKSSHSPEHAMLGLLEPHTAQRFRDEYLDVEMDVSPMAVFATANVALPAGSPLASRFTIVEIDVPSKEQMIQIARSVDKSLRSQMPVLACCFEPLSAEVIKSIAAVAPRKLRAKLRQAYAAAARGSRQLSDDRRLTLELSHFVDCKDARQGNAGSASVFSSKKSALLDLPLLVAESAGSGRIH